MVDWRGIELVLPIYAVLMLLVPVYGFIVFRRRVKHKVLTKIRAFLCYLGLVISPVAIYAIFLLGLVGFEEMTEAAMISEGLARSAPILIGLGLVVWLVSLILFGITLACTSGSVSSPKQADQTGTKRRRG